ncbi:hypothetical protein E5329_13825 [Petralouisia muris]|uniref:Uncharacterized protein n=1 Tax=Petralouisia muris TaxID=3032872 RepID=A0AC61RV85_9FIRM|nr:MULTISPECIES: hypothetical protein [Lachnospiraceae]MCX4324380.1 hypothetical protein [Lachnospiraceae bacterium]TGY95647.1 hypothetical protein E5329_13825 [Petralouisia muris]
MARPKKEDFNQIKYQNEFNKANYDRVEVNMPKGKKAIVKEAAAAAGQSVSEYINQAIDARMGLD